MPDAASRRPRSDDSGQRDAERLEDHAGISRLAEDLLPALMAKLASGNLGELEVREGDWRVRVRRPYGTAAGEGRRASDKPSRSQPGHEGHGHGRAAPEAHRSGRQGGGGSGATTGSGAAAAASTNGSGHARGGDGDGADRSRAVATSPAVGIFQPGPRASSGTRVRAGDVLGVVNMIGVPQDILAPGDGIVGATLVEAGTPVEYGQELIRMELSAPAESRS